MAEGPKIAQVALLSVASADLVWLFAQRTLLLTPQAQSSFRVSMKSQACRTASFLTLLLLLAYAHQANAAKKIPGNEGALPFPADLETNLFHRQLLKTISTNSRSGDAKASSSASGQNADVATAASSGGVTTSSNKTSG
ncbi:TPA: hypothetical protein ACH3X2_009697 [Trebouxia sp. C0005]